MSGQFCGKDVGEESKIQPLAKTILAVPGVVGPWHGSKKPSQGLGKCLPDLGYGHLAKRMKAIGYPAQGLPLALRVAILGVLPSEVGFCRF